MSSVIGCHYTVESGCASEQKTIKNGIVMRKAFELCSIMMSECSAFHVSITPQRCMMTPLSLQNPSEQMPPDTSYVRRLTSNNLPSICHFSRCFAYANLASMPRKSSLLYAHCCLVKIHE